MAYQCLKQLNKADAVHKSGFFIWVFFTKLKNIIETYQVLILSYTAKILTFFKK